MNKTAYFITAIKQTGNHTFAITWNDGVEHTYRLSAIQKVCPCAGCGEKGAQTVQEDVRAVRIVSVGRYALRIVFTSGCSAGIYSYDILRSFIDNSSRLIHRTQTADHE